jgi:Na+-transporting NADH:ubiquinone oxidoreductase subunit A
MLKVIKLKKGLDIKLEGEADLAKRSPVSCDYYAIKPTDFRALTPKLEVKIGDTVKAGDPLFSNKYKPEVKFSAPVSGVVEAIHRGEKRKILSVVVKADEKIAYREFNLPPLSGVSGDELVERLLESGLWPLIRQRPYDIIADPNTRPKAIFVSGFDSSPLAPDYKTILKEESRTLQAGLDGLNKLCSRPVNLNVRAEDADAPLFSALREVEIHYFSGPHPAGNAGIQIHHLNPINKGETVWVVNITDVVLLGRFFLTGRVDLRKTILLVGSEVTAPACYDTIVGAQIGSIVKDKLRDREHQRILSGSVLTGDSVDTESFLGFYHNMITVIPEGDRYEFLGWATPGFNKFSISRSYLSFLFPNKRYRLDANYHGERRAFVMSGQYEKVFPMEILPVYLLKAILSGDLEKMEQLGIYEVTPEDMALCEFVCTSKIPVQEIVDSGIRLMLKELM